MKNKRGEIICDDCGGWDIEWMYHCKEHGADYCRGCDCPECEEEEQHLVGVFENEEDGVYP